jgi:hypothetical protein
VSDAILLIFPSEVYRNDAEARDAGMAPEEKLRFHQQQSKPIIDGLDDGLKAQFAERKLPHLGGRPFDFCNFANRVRNGSRYS